MRTSARATRLLMACFLFTYIRIHINTYYIHHIYICVNLFECSLYLIGSCALNTSTVTTTVHCAPTQTQLTASNNININHNEAPVEPPFDFPQSAEDVKPAEAPIEFPTNGVDVDMRQADGGVPPPAEFPTDLANVIRVGIDAKGRHGANWTEPPMEFPTNRSLYTIKMPSDHKISETLSKLKVRLNPVVMW